MSAEQNKLIVRQFVEAMNSGDLAVLSQVVAPEFVHRNPANPQMRPGPEGVKQLIGTWRAAFPDAHEVIDDMIAEGDKVVTRWSFQGTQQGELMGIPPTSKPVSFSGIFIDRVAGGRIVEHWDEADMLGVLQQLGAVAMQPAAGTAPAAGAEPMAAMAAGIVAPGEGRAVSALGGQLTIKADGPLCTMVEEREPAQGGVPLHRHTRRDELIYVLDGEFLVTLGRETTRVTAGSCVRAPRGTGHGYRNAGSSTATALLVYTPGSYAGLFEALGSLAPDRQDPAEVMRVLREHDIEMLEAPPA